MKVHIAHYSQISKDILYSIFQLRSTIFVIEQNCHYLDLDGKDQQSFHAWAEIDGNIIGTARILPPDVAYPGHCSIGRVAIHAHLRNGNKGSQLMQAIMHFLSKEFKGTPVKISAQEYLVSFYENFGFTKTDDHYLEDTIPHVKMIFDNP